MNRKGTREQNDISIIIGNLPRRLQEKITREGATSNNNSGGGITDDGQTATLAPTPQPCRQPKSPVVGPATDACGCGCGEVPTIDYFLRMGAKSSTPGQPDAEASARVAERDVDETSVLKPDVAAAETAVAIPGIIRLNAPEAAQLTQQRTSSGGSSGGNNGLREGHRRSARAAHTDAMSTQPELYMSPVHPMRPVANCPAWFEAVDGFVAVELSELYERLTRMMQSDQVLENWKEFCAIRRQLQLVFAQLLLNHLKFCCEQKVDSFFWKALFYNVREYLKRQSGGRASKRILAVLDEGLEFYRDLHGRLTSKYLEKAAGCPNSTRRSAHKFAFIAKVAAQKLLICSGDLSRYKAKEQETNDYSEAAKYYHSAQALIPTNGIPYNQLAIVAIHARKKFDAIYFHMRSLMSSNAIHSARESLLVLFDEIRKKYEETELKTSPVHYYRNSNSNSKSTTNASSSRSMRKEIWVYPDGVRRLHRTDISGNNKMTVSEERRLNEMSTEELLRRFTSLYLYIIGKLYTGIGMESIQEHQRKILLQLSVLLKREPLAIARSRLLKTVALNIFVMEHNIHKERRREIRYHAFNFCNQIFGLVLRKANTFLAAFNTNEMEFEDQRFVDLNSLLQFVRIYALWLQQNVEMWEPVRSDEHVFLDCWFELQRLFAILKTTKLQLPVDSETGLVCEEDVFFAGFTPLATVMNGKSEGSSSASCGNTEREQFFYRLHQIAAFERTYLENEKSLDAMEEKHFIMEDLNAAIRDALDNLQDTNARTADDVNEDDGDGGGDGDGDVGDVGDEDEEDGDAFEDNNENIVMNGVAKPAAVSKPLKLALNSNTENSQLIQLTRLKRELEAKTNVKRMYNAKLEELLKFVDTKLYIEVRPKYLLPDTNCFIDCLEDFERLSKEFKRYILIIPLTVVKELDGLSKGVKLEAYENALQNQRIHHFDDVSTRAKKSLDFIKTAKNNVKCATTKGSIINASLFALVEEEHVSNDDKILATAMALSKSMSTETTKDGKCFIQTELVLITTDRNLRVKALSRNLAVSELSEFLQWAKDCHT